jgi:hypothetical protein
VKHNEVGGASVKVDGEYVSPNLAFLGEALAVPEVVSNQVSTFPIFSWLSGG